MIKNNFLTLLSTTVLISGLLFQTQINSAFAETDDSVKGPQYIYYATGITESEALTDDKLSAEQWALYNDGSFEMEEEQNQFPVYENPFEQPMNPGKWERPTGPSGGTSSMPNITNRNDQTNSQPGQGQRKMPTMLDLDKRASYLPHSFNSNYTIKTGSISAVAGIDINISEAWDLYESQRNVTVAIIDTGIDFNHEDLSNVMWVNQDEIAGNNTDDDGNGYIDDIYGWNFYNDTNNIYVGEEDDHGTHGAGTIAATKDNSVGIAGIADEDSVSIMSLKALGGEDGSGTTESIINAIKYAEANGASICNLSLGTTSYDQALYNAIANSNMLFVVAAGNGDSKGGTNIDSVPTYPAAFDLDNIISVANVSCDGNLSSSSNYGENSVDIAAPGSYILSLTADNGYAYMSGTSMAAPMVTGVAALVYTENADLSLADVKDAILNSATQLGTLSGKVGSGGMLNAGSALKYNTK